jgi:parvulin-like peptidyl-prolyl isomerase
MVKGFEDIAFTLQEDEISKPVKTEFGYHIIKVIEHRDEEVKEFDDAMKEQIRGTLKTLREREYAEAYVDSIKEQADYVYNEELLADDEDTTIQKDEWIAIVNDKDTLKYARYIDQKPKYMRYKSISEMNLEDQEDMIKTLAVNNLLIQIAEEKGFYQDSTIVEQKEQFILTQAKNRVEEMASAKDFEPTDSMSQAYFEEHMDEFVVDKPLHVYHIIFTDSAQAVAIYDSIINGADFVEMAKRYYPGEPEIREVAYDLDFISELEMPTAFWEAANSLQVGTVSPPVKTEWGWHVIKLVSRKRSKTYEQVKSRIRNTLREMADREALEKYLDKLRANSDIEINESLLEQYRITYYEGKPKLQIRE